MSLSIGELIAYVGVDVSKAEKGLDGFQKSLKSPKMQKAALAAGALAGAALAAGLASAVQKDTAVRALKASLDPASEEAERAGNAAGELFAQGYGQSIDEVTAATGAVVSSIQDMRKASEEDISKMTGTVMDLATAFEQDAGRAAQVVGQMITTGLAKDGAEAADLLTSSLQKVPKELRGDLLDAIDEYGPSFQQLGLSGEEAMSMLVKGSEKGMYGIDKTGDAVKEFALLVSTDMKKTQAPIEALGLNYEDMATKLLAGGQEGAEATGQIIDGLLAMKDPVKQAQAAVELFGTPIEDLNTSDIPQFLESLKGAEGGLGDFGGSAQRVTDELHNGPGAGLQEFKNNMQSTFGDMMTYMLPVLQPILDLLNQFAPILGPLAAIIGLVSAAIMVWTGVQWLLNAAMLANPVTWIVLGIMLLIGAVLLLAANWSSVTAWITEVWGGFMNFLSESLQKAGDGIGNFVDGAVEWFQGLPGKILDALGNLGNLLLDAGKQILDGFLEGLTNGFNAVKDFVGGIGTWIADHKGPKQYDLNLLVPAGGWIMDGLEDGIEASMPSLGTTLGDVSWMVANGIDPGAASTPTSTPAASATSGGIHIENLTIEGQEDPEATWRIFKSRLTAAMGSEGLSYGTLSG